jgi:NAD(P)-dependent dehydrogenase (short-subunit alcohol dehydrogenase family)
MDLQLTGKTVLVTGSSKGIGAGIARRFALEGAIVIVHGRDRAQAEDIAHAIVTQGGRAHVVLGDLTDDAAVAHLVEAACAFSGSIDILVNNAGGSGAVKEDWATATPATWAGTYDRNVLAALRVTTRVLPAMRTAKWGRVINISSLAATMPPAGGADYAAGKAAINAMTASLAKAVAGEGITVNAISPGTIHSDTLDRKFREVAAQHGLAPDAPWRDVERTVLPLFAQVPVGRVGNVDDIANAAAFLASPLAGYITGTNLRVDGGLSPVL